MAFQGIELQRFPVVNGFNALAGVQTELLLPSALGVDQPSQQVIEAKGDLAGVVLKCPGQRPGQSFLGDWTGLIEADPCGQLAPVATEWRRSRPFQKITPIERVGWWFDQQPFSLWAEL